MPPPEQNDLEQLAARIADEQPVDWRELDADTASVSGLREIEQLAQGFRHLQVSAVAPKTPTSNRFMFGNLQVLEPIGSGAQGEVWRAYDPLLDLQVALKLRKVESGVLSNQFLEEGRRLARVRQANIVSVYGAAIHGARAGIWSELVRGSPVSELLAEHGVFPGEEVRGIGLDLCHALAAVHRHARRRLARVRSAARPAGRVETAQGRFGHAVAPVPRRGAPARARAPGQYRQRLRRRRARRSRRTVDRTRARLAAGGPARRAWPVPCG